MVRVLMKNGTSVPDENDKCKNKVERYEVELKKYVKIKYYDSEVRYNRSELVLYRPFKNMETIVELNCYDEDCKVVEETWKGFYCEGCVNDREKEFKELIMKTMLGEANEWCWWKKRGLQAI